MLNQRPGGERGLNSASIEVWHAFQLQRIAMPGAFSCPSLFSALLKPAKKVVRVSFDTAELQLQQSGLQLQPQLAYRGTGVSPTMKASSQ